MHYKENEDFAREMLETDPLDRAIEWIKNNLEPEDVFSDEQLLDWAYGYGMKRTDDGQ